MTKWKKILLNFDHSKPLQIKCFIDRIQVRNVNLLILKCIECELTSDISMWDILNLTIKAKTKFVYSCSLSNICI